MNWKEIPGWPYEASDDGKVRKDSTKRELKSWITAYGYPRIQLWKNAVGKFLHVHQAVALAWLPNPEGYKQVNHKNGIKTDNRIDNLEWCSQSQNQKHRFAVLGHEPTRSHAKLTEEQVNMIPNMMMMMSDQAIANEFNVNRSTIGAISNRKSWVHLSLEFPRERRVFREGLPPMLLIRYGNKYIKTPWRDNC